MNLDFLNYEEMKSLMSYLETCKDEELVTKLNRLYIDMQERRSAGQDPVLTMTTERLGVLAARIAGSRTSKQKKITSAENGKLGGRPRRKPADASK